MNIFMIQEKHYVSKYSINENGKKHGKEVRYHKNGKILYIKEYDNGKLKEGDYEEYYSNGDLKNKYSINENRKKHGWYYAFNKDGSITRTCFYNNGKIMLSKTSKTFYVKWDNYKLSEYYHENGKLEQRTFYKNYEPHGIESIYNENGVLENTYKYNNGQIISSM